MLSFLRTGHHIPKQQIVELVVAGQYPIADHRQMEEAELQNPANRSNILMLIFPMPIKLEGIKYPKITTLSDKEFEKFARYSRIYSFL